MVTFYEYFFECRNLKKIFTTLKAYSKSIILTTEIIWTFSTCFTKSLASFFTATRA